MLASMPGVYVFSPSAIPVALTAVLIVVFGLRVMLSRFTSVSAASCVL